MGEEAIRYELHKALGYGSVGAEIDVVRDRAKLTWYPVSRDEMGFEVFVSLPLLLDNWPAGIRAVAAWWLTQRPEEYE